MACTVAPIHESNNEPNRPASATTRNTPAAFQSAPIPIPLESPIQVRAAAKSPMNIAPAREAEVPTQVIPPEVPVSTSLPLVMSRGRERLNTPSSVAQVSAVTVAIAAEKATHIQGAGVKKCRLAISAPKPPLASVWARSRRLPLLNFSVSDSLSPLSTRENTLDEMKKATRSTPQLQPPNPNVTVPIRRAPTTPDPQSRPRR